MRLFIGIHLLFSSSAIQRFIPPHMDPPPKYHIPILSHTTSLCLFLLSFVEISSSLHDIQAVIAHRLTTDSRNLTLYLALIITGMCPVPKHLKTPQLIKKSS